MLLYVSGAFSGFINLVNGSCRKSYFTTNIMRISCCNNVTGKNAFTTYLIKMKDKPLLIYFIIKFVDVGKLCLLKQEKENQFSYEKLFSEKVYAHKQHPGVTLRVWLLTLLEVLFRCHGITTGVSSLLNFGLCHVIRGKQCFGA